MTDYPVILQRIRAGEEEARDELIRTHKDYIRAFASSICRRKLDWHNDDELSVALIAFNRAIDLFNTERGENFLAYARVLIRNSLVDYFRVLQKVKGPGRVGITDELKDKLETNAALTSHAVHQDNVERACEIEIFQEILTRCGLNIESLARHSPRHKDTRETLKAVALQVSRNRDLTERIFREGKLPLREIQDLSGISRKILEKWRKYILSLVIIAGHGELEILSEYIWGKDVGREH